MQPRPLLFTALLAALGGCGGEYIITAPDVAALPGEQAPAVVRLQRREFWLYCPPIADAAIMFRSADGALRCARTDKAGYAAVGIDAPDQPGLYAVALHHQDSLGYTASGTMSLSVLSADKPVVAVDVDSLPAGGRKRDLAAEALGRIAREAQIVYLTHRNAGSPAKARERLKGLDCPAGAILPWRPQPKWHQRLPWRRRGGSALAALRQRFGKLQWAVTADADVAREFDKAGIRPLVVEAPARVEAADYFKSWPDLNLPLRPET